MSDVLKALHELRTKTKTQIETETAATWTARACAAYHIWAESAAHTGTPSPAQRLHLFSDAVEYEHEALEHAAAAGLDVLEACRAAINAKKHSLGLI